jgi:Chitobiase/beta-hexosaminidase C-terminal domain/Fibronectin type III domain
MSNPSRTGAPAGVSTGSPPGGNRAARRGRKAAYAGVALTTLATSLLIAPGTAQAALPLTADDNLTIFPNRDMITMEGWAGRADQDVTIEVYRGTQLMGAAKGKAGFEINHPGGACWGNDPSFPQVTPDIQAGDKVVAKFIEAGTPVTYETIVQDVHVDPSSDPEMNATGTGFTVSGHIGEGVNPANFEQRIINPDLTDTEIGRRDIRALPGPVVPSDKGGYSSGVAIAGTTFTATYQFTDPNAARNAAMAQASGGERAMAWESVDAAGERLGLTIAEDDEPGGPGMGGCPMGPADANPTAGQYHVNWGTDADGNPTAAVLWGEAAAEPGASPLTGYSVEAVEKTDSDADGERDVVGRRTDLGDVDSTLTGLHGTSQDWAIEVRALTENGVAGPLFAQATSTGGTPAPGTEADGTVPTATFAVDTAGKVVLSSNEADAQLFYTVDGTDLLDATGQLTFSPSVLHYTEPFAVAAANTTVKFVAIDAAGNTSTPGTGTASPAPAGPAAAPAVPVGVTATADAAALQRVIVNWVAPVDTGNLPLTRFQVRVTAPAEGTTAEFTQTMSTTDASTLTRTIGGLTAGRTYSVEVRAQNAETLADGTQRIRSSEWTTPLKVTPGDLVSGALVRNDAGDIRIEGASSQRNVTITIYRTTDANNVNKPAASTQVAQAIVTNAVAPATGVTFEYRDRVGTPFPAGTVIWVKSSKGGVASFTV